MVVKGDITSAPFGAFRVRPSKISPDEVSIVSFEVVTTISKSDSEVLKLKEPSALEIVFGSSASSFPFLFRSANTVAFCSGPLIAWPECVEILSLLLLPPPHAIRARLTGETNTLLLKRVCFSCFLRLARLSFANKILPIF